MFNGNKKGCEAIDLVRGSMILHSNQEYLRNAELTMLSARARIRVFGMLRPDAIPAC